MTRSLWHRKVWNGHSKGISTVLGTVFLTLVVFAISTNVFLWTLSRNAEYTLAVKEENQKNIDRLNENVIASNTNYSVLEKDEVTVKVTLTNAGSVAIQIVSLWVFDTTQQKYANAPVDYSLNAGQASDRIFTVPISGANASHALVSWFVTARGNTVPLQTAQSVVVADLAQGIGSISMDFKTFSHYIPVGDELGLPAFNFSIPGGTATVFGISLTNLDTSRMDINLTGRSCVWLIVPGTAASDYWPIVKVVDGVIQDGFDYQILEYGEKTVLYFGPVKPKAALQDKIAAVNILLYGKIGPNDYGQNIPFAAVYVEK